MYNLNLLLLTVTILLLWLLNNHLLRLAVNLLLRLDENLLLRLAIKLLLLLLMYHGMRWLSQETRTLLLLYLWLHVKGLLLWHLLRGLNHHLLAELVVGNLRDLLRLDVLDNWLLISADTTAHVTSHASVHALTTEK